ncbi:MAG: hypothetical protein VW127_07445 [Flavobacteriaceae bacterium]|jgi:hypothetical protein
MKKVILAPLAIFLLFCFCSKEPVQNDSKNTSSEEKNTSSEEVIDKESEDNLTSDLPENARKYISSSYPNDMIVENKKTESSDYKVSLRTSSILNVSVKKTLYFDSSGNLIKEKSSQSTHLYTGLVDCFEFVYPISFTLGSNDFEVSDRESLLKTLKDWYIDHPESNESPKLKYPLEIKDKDGALKTIRKREELNEAFEDCYPGFFGWYHQYCYTINYPISYKMPDDSVITGNNSKDLYEKIKEWYDDNPDELVKPVLQYPIEIKQEDGTLISVANEKDLKKYFDECRLRGLPLEWDWGYWDWTSYYEWYWGRCFNFSYPISYEMPDGSSITVESKFDAWQKFKNWYNDHPNETKSPKWIFPLTIIDDEDKKTVINNEDELRDQYHDCYKSINRWNWDWSWNWDWGYWGWNWNWGKCYTIEYPLTYTLPDGSKVTGSSRSELLRKFKDWYDDHPEVNDRPDLNYPITIKKEDGEKVVVKNKEEFESIYLDCYKDWEEQWKNWGEAWKEWDKEWTDWNEAWKDWIDNWRDFWKDWWDNL